MYHVADRFQTQHVNIKKAGTCLSYKGLWTGLRAIDILPICTTPRMASRHTKPDCPSALKNCPDFLVKMNYLSAPGIFPPGSTTKIGNYS